MKMLPLSLFAAAAVGGDFAAAPTSLVATQSPLVIAPEQGRVPYRFRDQWRAVPAGGCHGSIRYRVSWKTEDGVSHSELKQVSYPVSPNTARAIAVDRHTLTPPKVST